MRSFFLGFVERRRFVSSVITPKQDFDFAFSFVKPFLAIARKTHTLLEQLQRSIEGQIAPLELPDDLLKLFER